MPEGPEIKRLADGLKKQIAGKFIDSIRFGLEPLRVWESRLLGARVVAIETYGKAMVTRLLTADSLSLNIYSHNQLYGRWVFCDTDAYPVSKRQLRLAIDCQGKSALLYSASDIAVLDNETLRQHPFLRKLGPDVLDETITVEHIAERLASKRYRNRQLGTVLTDQSFVAGLGNYLRCEILYYVSLCPSVRCREVSEMKLKELAGAIIELPRQSYRTAGITNDIKHAQALMKEGRSFEDSRFYVFRRQGLPCYRCGARIEKLTSSGQACYLCQICQAS